MFTINVLCFVNNLEIYGSHVIVFIVSVGYELEQIPTLFNNVIRRSCLISAYISQNMLKKNIYIQYKFSR